MKYFDGTGLWWLTVISGSMIIMVIYMTVSPALDGIIDTVRGPGNAAVPDGSEADLVISRMSNMFNLAFLFLLGLMVLYGILRVLKSETQSEYYEV